MIKKISNLSTQNSNLPYSHSRLIAGCRRSSELVELFKHFSQELTNNKKLTTVSFLVDFWRTLKFALVEPPIYSRIEMFKYYDYY
jgi:hypothetical protein